MDFNLEEIKAILDRPGFDVLRALESHRVSLEEKDARLKSLVYTVERTIIFLKGELGASDKELFDGFDEKKQREYAENARRRWGSELVDESVKKWGSHSARFQSLS